MRVVANRAAETITAAVRKRFSSLIIELPVQQAGSGDPSPDNIRPIAQWTDVELYVADTDTASEPTVTTTLPTPIFGGMVDVARGEVASLYNEKKSSSGWEMVEEGQFRCQVGAFNNGDETSTNVADLYSSHYKTVSNKDAYDATDDLTCGTPTIEGVTYLYVNDLDYTTLEAFTAYIGDVQFVYKSHIPMSDEIAPTIVYLPEGTSYVWAEGAFYVETVTGTPPLSLPNSVGEPLESWNVALSPYQDLHGYDAPWPAGGGKNKLPLSLQTIKTINTAGTWNGDTYTDAGVTYKVNTNTVGEVVGIVVNGTASQNSFLKLVQAQGIASGEYILNGAPSGTGSESVGLYVYTSNAYWDTGSGVTVTIAQPYSVNIRTLSGITASNVEIHPMLRLSSVTDATFATYSNICPIIGTDKVTLWTAGKNLLNINRTEIIDSYEEGGSTAATTPRTFTENQMWIGLAFNNYFNPNRIDSYSVTSNSVTVNCNSTAYGIGFPLKCSPNMQFTVSHTASTDAYISIAFYDKDGNLLSYVNRIYIAITYTTPADSAWMCIVLSPVAYYDTTYNNLQLEFGNTASDYVPFASRTPSVITLPSTIYTGQVSNDGAVSSWGDVDLSTLRWYVAIPDEHIFRTDIIDMKAPGATDYPARAQGLMCEQYRPDTQYGINANMHDCSMLKVSTSLYVRNNQYANVSDFSASLSGVKLIYELATSTSITLITPDIPTINGNATAWATAEDGIVDNMTVEYTRIAEQES